MSQFSEDEVIAISKTPLRSRLDGIRQSLQSGTLLSNAPATITTQTGEIVDGQYLQGSQTSRLKRTSSERYNLKSDRTASDAS